MLSPRTIILVFFYCGILTSCTVPQWGDGPPPLLTDHSIQQHPYHRNPYHHKRKSKAPVTPTKNDKGQQPEGKSKENDRPPTNETVASARKDKQSQSVVRREKKDTTKSVVQKKQSTSKETLDGQTKTPREKNRVLTVDQSTNHAEPTEENRPKDNSITSDEVYEKLKDARDIDLESPQQLHNDLKRTDPEFWPHLMKNIRTAPIIHEPMNDLPEDSKEMVIAKQITADEIFRQPRNMLREQGTSIAGHPTSRRKRTDNPVRLAQFYSETKATEKSDKRSEIDHEASDSSQMNDGEKHERDDKRDNWIKKVSHVSDIPLREGIWQQQLHFAIESLEAELQESADGEILDTRNYESTQAILRLLYLIGGRGDDAMAKIPELDEDRQEFWSKLIFALKSYLGPTGSPVTDRRAESALHDLQEAMASLANVSRLHIANLAFCSNVESFGQYTTLEPYLFPPDQEVLLYAEIDNFAAEHLKEGGYKTEMEGSYQILDRSGRRVADRTFASEEEICRNRRRDYFIPFRMWIPKDLYPGEYTLQLTIEDKVGDKFGQASIDFKVEKESQ